MGFWRCESIQDHQNYHLANENTGKYTGKRYSKNTSTLLKLKVKLKIGKNGIKLKCKMLNLETKNEC